MAELFLRTDDGKEIPIKKVEGLSGDDVLIVRLNGRFRPEHETKIQERLSDLLHREVVILDSTFGEILSVKAGD